MKEEDRLQTTQHTSDKAVTEVLSNCYANCVDTSRLQQWGPEIPFFWKSGHTDPLDGWHGSL